MSEIYCGWNMGGEGACTNVNPCSDHSSKEDLCAEVDDLRARLSETERERDEARQHHEYALNERDHAEAKLAAAESNLGIWRANAKEYWRCLLHASEERDAVRAELGASRNQGDIARAFIREQQAQLDEAVGLLRRFIACTRKMFRDEAIRDAKRFLSRVAPQPEVKSMTIKEWIGFDKPQTKGEE